MTIFIPGHLRKSFLFWEAEGWRVGRHVHPEFIRGYYSRLGARGTMRC